MSMPPIIIDIPILETPRLILRGHKLEDFEASVAIWSDPVVCRYFHGAPMTREDIWGRLLRTFGMWAAFDYGSWAVEEKESGDYIGRVGVAEVKRDLDPALEGMPEAGWTLAARVHGKGYATEAMQAALAWSDARLGQQAHVLHHRAGKQTFHPRGREVRISASRRRRFTRTNRR